MIFQLVPMSPFADDDPDEVLISRIWGSSAKNPLHALNLLHVCGHWRQIALSISTFWSTANGLLGRPPEILVEAARETPPKVVVIETPNTYVEELLLFHGPRFGELHWEAGSMELFIHYLDFQAPILEVLSLRGTAEELETPLVLFQGHVPRLRSLSMKGFVSLPVMPFPSLIQLHLSRCGDGDFLTRILNMLSGCPHLEDLVMDSLCFLLSDSRPSTDYVVPLLRLRRLVLENVADDTTQSLLPHLKLAANTAVRLLDAGSANRICEAISSLPVTQSLTKVCIRIVGRSLAVTAVGSASGVFMKFPVDTYTVNPLYELSMLPSMIPVAQVDELWILDEGSSRSHPSRGFNSSVIYDWLVKMSNLKKLVVYDRSISTTIQPLSRARILGLCPNLLQLHILLHTESLARTAIEALFAHEEEHGIKHLNLGYLPSYIGNRIDESVGSHFDFVQYQDLKEHPSMDMPVLCTTETHPLWPSWKLKRRFPRAQGVDE